MNVSPAPPAAVPAVPDALLRDAVAIAADAVVVTDADQRLVYVNDGVVATFGYSADEILGQPLDLLLPQLVERDRTGDARAFATSGEQDRPVVERTELTGRRKNGEEFPADVALACSTAGGGHHYVATIRDVSEHRRHQLVLREAQFRTLIESAHDGIFVCDAANRILLANPAFAAMCGRPRATLLGMAVSDLVAPEDLARAPLRRAALETTGQLHSERVLCQPDGTRVFVEVATTRLDDGQVQCIVHDVTERRRMEQRLRESEETLRNAFDYAGIGKALTAPDGRLLRVNSAMCRLLGYDEADLLTRNFRDITHPDDLTDNLALIRDTLAGRRQSFVLEKRYLHKDGHTVWTLLHASLVRDPEGNPRFFVAQLEDTTERREATLALERQRTALVRSNAELEQFAYVASHDLQEPLRAVASYTQLLAERYAGQLDARADKYIRYAIEGAERMQALIRDLLALSRVGTHGARFAEVDLAAVCETVRTGLRVAIVESGAEVDCTSLPRVWGDAGQLGQVLQNLLVNAIKFRRPAVPPRVQVSARITDEGWEVAVRDNGIGIEPRYAERVFVMFQRLHTRDEYPGTGIGLAICKKVVERHGGRIWIEPAPDGGAIVRFTIARPPALAAADRARAAGAESTAADSRGSAP